MKRNLFKYSLILIALLSWSVGCDFSTSGCSIGGGVDGDYTAPNIYLIQPSGWYAGKKYRYPTNAYIEGKVSDYESVINGVYYSLDGTTYQIIAGTEDLPANQGTEHSWSAWIDLPLGQTNLYLKTSDSEENENQIILGVITSEFELSNATHYIYPSDKIYGSVSGIYPYNVTGDYYRTYLFASNTYRFFTDTNTYQSGFEADTFLVLKNVLDIVSSNSSATSRFTELTQTIDTTAEYTIIVGNSIESNAAFYYALGVELLP